MKQAFFGVIVTVPSGQVECGLAVVVAFQEINHISSLSLVTWRESEVRKNIQRKPQKTKRKPSTILTHHHYLLHIHLDLLCFPVIILQDLLIIHLDLLCFPVIILQNLMSFPVNMLIVFPFHCPCQFFKPLRLQQPIHACFVKQWIAASSIQGNSEIWNLETASTTPPAAGFSIHFPGTLDW